MGKTGFGAGLCGVGRMVRYPPGMFFGGWGFSGKFPQLKIPSFPRRRESSLSGFYFFR